MAQWFGDPRSNVEFFADNIEQVNGLAATLAREGKDSPTLQGRVRPRASAPMMPNSPEGAREIPARVDTSPTTMDLTKEAPKDMVGQARDALVGPGSAGRTVLGPIGDAIHGVLPGSIPEAAIDAAIPVGGAVAKTGSGLANAAIRTGVPTLVGGIVGGMQGGGEGARQGAGTGAIASLGGEVAGVIPRFIQGASRMYGTMMTPANHVKVAKQVAPIITDAIGTYDVPTLGKVTSMNGLNDLLLLPTKLGGQKPMSAMFEKTEGAVAQAMKASKIPVNVPIGALVYSGHSMRKSLGAMGHNVTTPMDAGETIGIIHNLGDALSAGSLKPTEIGAARKFLNDTVTDLTTKLAAIDKPLAAQYEQIRSDYGKFKNLQAVLTENKADVFPNRGGSKTIDLGKFNEVMHNNIDRISPSDFPTLWQAFGGVAHGPVTYNPRGGPRVSAGGYLSRVAETLRFPEHVAGLSDEMKAPLTSKTRRIVESPNVTPATRNVAGIASVPTVAKALRDRLEQSNGPLPSEVYQKLLSTK